MKNINLVAIIVALFFSITIPARAQRVMVTLAGTGVYGFSGDGGPGYMAQTNTVNDICQDAAGNFYIVDEGNNRVRKLSAKDGTISTIAGGGTSTADGVPATSAILNGPRYICLDGSGNVYISFELDNKVKKISAATGYISTIAGTGAAGYSGDGGPATAATLYGPNGVATDTYGNLYVVDRANNCVRKITAATGVISTVAGGPVAGYTGDGGIATAARLSLPVAVAINAAGDIYVSDQNGAFIRKIASGTGIITTIAGCDGCGFADGVAPTASRIGNIWGMCVDDTGNVFIDDESCSCMKISVGPNIIHRVAGDYYMEGYNGDCGDALSKWFNFPYGLCVDQGGSIYVADRQNSRIRKAIQLTAAPSFAYGKGQTIYTCSGAPSASLDSRLAITDLNAGQTETWTVVTPPATGSLSGFPATATSVGPGGVVTPTGLSYIPASGFSTIDSFKVRVSDGSLSEVMTVYIRYSTSTLVSAGTITGPTTVCASSAITLTATTTGGVWTATNNNCYMYGMDGTVSGMTDGVDTIIYTVTGTCNVATASYVVTVLPSPDPGYITGPDSMSSMGTICKGASIPLTESLTSGVWSTSDATIATVNTSGVVTGVNDGYATISYTVTSGGCSAHAEYLIVVGCTMAVSNVNGNTMGITIFPNPASGHFAVTVSSPAQEPATINVTNIVGQKLKELTTSTNNTTEIDLGATPGIYFINVSTAHGNRSSKVVIE